MDSLDCRRRTTEEHQDKPERDRLAVDEARVRHSLDEEHANDGEHDHLDHRTHEHGHQRQARERAGELDAREADAEEDERERDRDASEEFS